MKGTKDYWLAVASVSDQARELLEEAGCLVRHVHVQPPVVLVCLPYQSAEEANQDLEYWTHGEVRIKSKKISLYYDGLFGNIADAKILVSTDEKRRHEHNDVRVTRWQDLLAEPDIDPFA